MLSSPQPEVVDAVVIGAGVIGLACARALSSAGLETLILEQHDAFGTETSTRNSEVIHAGIYYPEGSRKARLCVSGRKRLYAFCETHGVSHRRCGKLIVANSPAQEIALLKIFHHAQANGVADIRLLTRAEAAALEPQLKCAAALLSPATGIIDSHGLMLALLGDAEHCGAMLATNSPALSACVREDGKIGLNVGGAAPMKVAAKMAVNAAGLHAQKFAAAFEGFPADRIPPVHYAKGNYFSLSGRSPFSRLVYPVPEPGGLGVHFTLDLAGQGRFGPDVEWVDALSYEVDAGRCQRFYGAVRKYWPGLADGSLQPAYSGIRPKLSGPGAPDGDFVIQGHDAHGIRGLVNLFGIESPGLTSCLAIAAEVCALLGIEEACGGE
ncbi:Aminobutyraldehyde dehydrogenase [Georgfuchsia toluolica]|uniref:Aminobutyraldehyde dehydrogenase n=1 Tax=Georgfuchsia toluolica TaxID=424218 RepID=A0A916N9K5_9PROT|nr:NAD(P)/FAD-dependent oxidoreductase [Georgfuchsia toluolica]CAG4884697.1 Aminobutyraldehyde dehydrogenase [Georgfuchsia toluolica]